MDSLLPSATIMLVGLSIGVMIGRYQRHSETRIQELEKLIKRTEPTGREVKSRIIEPPLTPEELKLKEYDDQIAAINPQLSEK